MARPGIMIYFDMLGPLRVLPDADKGRLFVAMLEYGQSGTVPEFDGMLALAWGFVKPKIDKDSEEYNRTVLKRQYATFCRDRKKNGEPEIGFDEWLKTIGACYNQNHHMISHDTTWYPTTTTTTITTTPTPTATAAAANANTNAGSGDGAENRVDVLGGDLGKGVVFLSNEQMSDLLDKLGLDTFNHYVTKLATFIIDQNAQVKNHYETILKWWREDSVVQR